jgi:hypothetical protein
MRAGAPVSQPPRTQAPIASVDNPPATSHPSASDEVAPSTAASPNTLGTFRGRVVDAVTREPVREFELRLQSARQADGSDEPVLARTFQTPDGRFEWQSLPPGKSSITASAHGYQRFELFDLIIPAGKVSTEIVLPLRAGHTLRGRVYDESSGVGIAAASVDFHAAMGPYAWSNSDPPRARTASDGTFVLEGMAAGPFVLKVSADQHAGRDVEVVVREDNPLLEIGLATGGTIAGRLTAADGITPLQGTVWLWPDAGLSTSRGFSPRQQTGDSGEFSYANLSAGSYRLDGQASGGSARQDIALASSQRLDGIVLALSSGHDIQGVVMGLRPEELKLATIEASREGSGNTYSLIPVDDRGAYVLRGVQPGQLLLRVTVPMHRQLERTIEMPANADLTVNFDFPRGFRLTGRVTRSGKPLTGLHVWPRTTAARPSFARATTTSPQGEYVVPDLPADEYTLLLGGVFRSGSVRVAGDTVFDIEVPDAEISGSVLEAAGSAPVVDADLSVWSADPVVSRLRRNARTDHLGRFALIAMEPGDFLLSAYKPGYELFRKRISFDGKSLTDMTIRLNAEQGVEIRARAAGSGKPLQQLSVGELLDGDRGGIHLQLRLDERGLGYIPSALAGSRLMFSPFDAPGPDAPGYHGKEIGKWDGRRLDLEFERAPQ